MIVDPILNQKIKTELERLKKERNFQEIAKLITYAFQVNSRWQNLKIFGYLPKLFRIIKISSDPNCIQQQDIIIGEPVIYQVYYANQQQLYDLNYFYIFCYLKEQSQQLNVYFQSANYRYKDYNTSDYQLSKEKIKFEGSISAFDDNKSSTMSVSDPGQFLPKMTSSYYVGSPEINFPQVIAQVTEKIINLANIKLQDTLFFGSSAGTFGALLSSTYLTKKTNVLAVNGQINIHYRKDIIRVCFNLQEPQKAFKQFGLQLSCLKRFKQDLEVIPNIYILANINDKLHQRNFNFYQNYIEKYTNKGINNQSVFDSYYGIDGHGRPEVNSLKAKIRIAREVLTMKSIQE